MNHKIILGTVQFGLNYGINNFAGKPSEEEIFEILDIACKNNIDCLDTADTYGDSTALIGNYHKSRNFRFKVLNKFKNVKQGELGRIVRDSLVRLNIEQFEVYSYHSFNDYISNQYILADLIELKAKGLVKKIGISLYTNAELEKAIEDINLDVIQLPYNILDNNNIRGYLIERAKQNGKEIHVRSVFLQGLFFMDFRKMPIKLQPLKQYIQKIKDFCNSETIPIHCLALSYVIFNKNINNILIGVDNSTQLINNLNSIENNQKAFDFINNSIFIKETDLLNPVNWK